MKKRLVIGATVAALTVSAVGIGGATYAATAQGSGHAGIMRRIGGERAHGKLEQAVRDGVITEAQKTAFKNEVKALRSELKAAVTKDSTKQQRQAERDKLKTELKAWASSNNFPLAKIFPKLAE